jgi:hydroxymethylpyrimidine pyrophosphatase-like HAD family hydrolase
VPFISLLSTDFDGTLAEGFNAGPCVTSLASELDAVIAEGALWAVNTGRDLQSALRGLQELQAPVSPHYILTSERHIHRPDQQGGWHDYGDWNRICREHHELLFAESGRFFDRISGLADAHQGVGLLRNRVGVTEGLVAESEEILDEVIARLLEMPGRPEDFHYQRSNIYLRFCHRRYDKGSALGELSRLLEMPSAGILSIGDHQNDLSMLLGDVSGMVACPANAHQSVKEAVRNAGGHVSLLEAGAGTAEAIHLYRTGKKQGSVPMEPIPA